MSESGSIFPARVTVELSIERAASAVNDPSASVVITLLAESFATETDPAVAAIVTWPFVPDVIVTLDPATR